jgi:hypothetical protein
MAGPVRPAPDEDGAGPSGWNEDAVPTKPAPRRGPGSGYTVSGTIAIAPQGHSATHIPQPLQ